MSTLIQGLFALLVAMVCAYMFVAMTQDVLDPQGWNDAPPDVPGWYQTRLNIKGIEAHEKAFWDGKWRYKPDGNACLIQEREWREEA